MTTVARWLGLAVAVLAAVPAWAGTGHFYMPASMFRNASGGAECTLTTWSGLSAGDQTEQPVWELADPTSATNCVLRGEFWFPESNTGVTFTPVLHLGEYPGSVTNKLCARVAYSVAAPTGVAWAYTDGTEGTYVTDGITAAGTAGTDQVLTLGAMTAYRVTGNGSGANCSGTNCDNRPGLITVERCECGVDAGCAAGTDTSTASNQLLMNGVDVYWTTP